MKKIKTYKQLFETGEWNRGVDLDFVLENPDCDSEECEYIKYMYNTLLSIRDNTDSDIFVINDIRGFDLYQGAYGKVYIFNKQYEIWSSDEPGEFWIEDFPVDNCSEEGLRSGFMGDKFDIIELINKINDLGGDPEKYNDIKKYNV